MRRVKAIVGTIGFLGLSFPAARAEAACCTGFTQQCAGSKSVWCVQNGAPAGTLPASFCPYGDEVVTELETLFNIPAPGTFEFDVEWPPNHGAHTGTDCSTFGDGVTGDAFTGPGPGNVTGFWGYLLALHEAINDWTGMSTPGWPTDYWADHISGFPNEMDWRIMGTLGAKLNDANLIAASPAQKARFWPNGDGPPDSRVQMFDDIFVLPNMGNGYEGFSRIFGLIQADKLSWDSVATNGANPDERRSEYVAAYLSLGAGQSVLPIMQTPGPGYASGDVWPVCAGHWDGSPGDPGDPAASPATTSYTCSEANIDAIATAHCSIAAAAAAGTDETADKKAFTSGDFAGVKAAGKCGGGCPTECGCKTSTGLCVAPWLADALADGGAGTPGSSGGGGDAGAGSSGGSSSGGVSGSGSSSGSAGSSSGGATSSGGGTGSGSGGASGSGSSSGNGAGASSGTGTSPGTPGASSGCGCRSVGGGADGRSSALLAFSAFLGLALLRVRRRR
jgi:MYXO-CTERM domain-containing protein